MRKLFLFATVAAAGLFASCSSTDDAISDAGNPVENVDDGKTAIKIGIGNLVNMETRGTGTVGGVGDGTNVWAGQKINVFMFNKITTENQTLTLTNEPNPDYDPADQNSSENRPMYDNQVMITPGPGNAIPGYTGDDAAVASGEAMIEDGSIKYYPYTGNFDFFGYHADDAVTGAVATEGTGAEAKMYVPFTINGSQDLMSAKAKLTEAQATAMTGTRANDYYSAYSARKEVHPTLTFQHLLTRLQFKVKAGNESSAGYHEATEAVNWTAATAAAHNADLDGALAATAGPFYSFTACWTSELNAPTWTTTGKVQFIKEQTVENETYTIVQVIQNNLVNHADMDGKYFAVKNTAANLATVESEELYWVTKDGDNYTIGTTTQAETILAGGAISVYNLATVTTADATTAINNYNATLTGAVTAGTVRIAAQAAGVDPTRAVTVEEIQIFSKTTGKLMAAWVNDAAMDDHAKIVWDEQQPAAANRWLSLMERPSVMYNLNNNETITRADIAAYSTMTDDDYAALTSETTPKKSEVDAAVAAAGSRINAAVYATLTQNGKDKYTVDNSPTNNDPLVPLTPKPITGGTYDANATPKWQVAENQYTSIGEALIVAPNDWTGDAYTPANMQMRVKVSQMVPTNWNDVYNLEKQEQTYTLEVPYPAYDSSKAGSGAFMCNTSYNIILTVYGYNRIEVIAEVNPWDAGGNRNIGDDEENPNDWGQYTEDTQNNNPEPQNP